MRTCSNPYAIKKTLFREFLIFWGGRIVLDLLHAHRVPFSVFRTCQRHLFAIWTNSLCSCRPSANPLEPPSTVLIHRPQKNIKKDPLRRSFLIFWGGRIRTSEMPGPKPGALPLGDAPSH